MYSVVWQQGLVEREINELLRELTRENYQGNPVKKNETEVEQRAIEETDVCPICQEEFLANKCSITYCRSVDLLFNE